MQVIICSKPENVAERTAEFIVRQLKKKSDQVLGLATGNTPLLLYKKLIEFYQKGDISFRFVITFNLDEYIGLEPSHPQSYHHYMKTHFFDHIDIDLKNTNIPQGHLENPFQVVEDYEKHIHNAGGIDIQILGIGRNGHIGFNEPSSSLSSLTRVKTLTQETILDNSKFFKPGEFQPVQAITMGMKTISDARMILLLATGKAKARAVAQAIEGPVSASCPASFLQFHRHTVFLIDEEAAIDLSHRDYYSHVDNLTQNFEKLHRLSDI